MDEYNKIVLRFDIIRKTSTKWQYKFPEYFRK